MPEWLRPSLAKFFRKLQSESIHFRHRVNTLDISKHNRPTPRRFRYTFQHKSACPMTSSTSSIDKLVMAHAAISAANHRLSAVAIAAQNAMGIALSIFAAPATQSARFRSKL